MKKDNKHNRSKIQIYFAIFVILLVAQVVTIFVLNFRFRNVVLDNAEDFYHRIDRSIANNYLKDADKDSVGVIIAEDNDSYVAIINSDGKAIARTVDADLPVNDDDVFKLIDRSKVYDFPADVAKAALVSGESGRLTVFYSNQNKVIIYTPIDENCFVVRILPNKYFNMSREPYNSALNAMSMINLLFAAGIFGVIFLFWKYATKVENNNARHELIAADNDLISFTYHSSIACFEMTGAVAKIFGEEIGKRSQIDWNTLSSMLHPDDQNLLRNISKAIKNGEAKYTTEFRMISKSGDYCWYRMNGKSVLDDEGNVAKFVGTIQNSDDQITHENMLKNKAEHDLLTGILNKVTTEESVNKVISASSNNTFAFYIIDLDNFKSVNDKLGHAAGDKVLTEVASKLQLVFNENDVIGRLGGDEFAVLLVIPAVMTSQSEKLIREKANLVNDLLRTEYGDDEVTIHVSASIGIARCPDAGEDFQSLYQNADKALYYSKEHGKNQFTFYEDVK